MIPKKRMPTHPGDILKSEFLEPNGITPTVLAQKTGIPVQRINMLINGKHTMTAEIAVQLSKAFGTTAEFWMNLQVMYNSYKTAIKQLAKLGGTEKQLRLIPRRRVKV